MRTRIPASPAALACAAFLVLCGCAGAEPVAAGEGTEPIVGLPCEGCENVFVRKPEALGPRARIVPEDQPGEPMVIEGTVTDADGRPAAGIVVYAYQTDAGGIYPRDPAGRTGHGSLRAWAVTGEDGRYRFDTIRPGAYPERTVPQHVHMHVLEPGCCTYYIDSILFRDDPRLSEREVARQPGRGGGGVVTPRRNDDSGWIVTRDILLGQDVPGHPASSRRGSS